VPVTVDAVVYFRVVGPEAAVVKVENFLKATSLISQTTLRSVLGQAELDELLSQRDKINMTLQEIIDRQTDPWGIKVTAVEVKDVVLPDSMKRAMAGQAESERERRAKIINAEGEFQAAEKLVQAAAMISTQPIALQLRFLQTMKEISSEHNTTTILPVPIDLFRPFIKAADKEKTE
jgi:regulator of protease activity HflC (stomatin/prohibitin superfamily)